jgi:hypothetical protein
MTTSTLSAASAALESLLHQDHSSSNTSVGKKRHKTKKRVKPSASLLQVDLGEEETSRRREAEKQKRVKETVSALKRGSVILDEEREVREEVCIFRVRSSVFIPPLRSGIVGSDFISIE